MDKSTIAVIIPVYKVEKYLKKCVDSIIAQDYTNLEIILVDDGSPDHCPQLCDEMAQKDSRIKVIHKENGGLSDARNVGIEVCTSDYVVFVDSDDYVENTYISSLINLKNKFNADIACTPRIYEFENGKSKKIDFFEDMIVDVETAKATIIRAKHGIGVTVCSKLFPVDAIKKHPFPIGKLHEDLAIAMQLFNEFSRIAIGSTATYHYIQHPMSIMHHTINNSSLFWILDYVNSEFPKAQTMKMKYALAYRLFDLVNEYCLVIDLKNKNDLIEKIQEYLRPYRNLYIHDSENSNLTKLKGWLLAGNKFTFNLFCKLKNVNMKRYE